MKISSFSPNTMQKHSNNESFKGTPGTIYLPKIVGEFGKFVGEYVGIPEKKLIQNTTPLYLQPHFDLKYAEDDEKTDIAIKSASKAIAGGITGVAIRAGCISFFKNKINFDPHNGSLLNKLLLPERAERLRRDSENLALKRLKTYNETLGTIAAILIMTLFTNKNIDVPLTGTIHDVISGVVKDNKTWPRSIYDTYKIRKEKVENVINKIKAKDAQRKEKLQKIFDILKENPNTNQMENKKKWKLQLI